MTHSSPTFLSPSPINPPALSLEDRKRKSRRQLVAVLLAVFGVCLVGTGVLFLVIVGSIKGSDAYRTSFEYAQRHPEVVLHLGNPLTEGFLPSGSVNRTGQFGQSQLSIDLHGPRGSGTVHVTAQRDGIRWIVQDAKLEMNGRVIELTPAVP